jgi:hypothetical protein
LLGQLLSHGHGGTALEARCMPIKPSAHPVTPLADNASVAPLRPARYAWRSAGL